MSPGSDAANSMGSGSPTSSLGQKDFEKFEKFEQAISEQMDVIEKLTDEKSKIFVSTDPQRHSLPNRRDCRLSYHRLDRYHGL